MSICWEERNTPIALHIQCHNCAREYVFRLRRVPVDYSSPDAIANSQKAVKTRVERALAKARTRHKKSAPECSPRFTILLDQEHIVSVKEVSQ